MSSCGAATLQARAAHRGPVPLTHTCGSVGRNVCVFLCRAVLPGEQRNGLSLTGCIFGKHNRPQGLSGTSYSVPPRALLNVPVRQSLRDAGFYTEMAPWRSERVRSLCRGLLDLS